MNNPFHFQNYGWVQAKERSRLTVIPPGDRISKDHSVLALEPVTTQQKLVVMDVVTPEASLGSGRHLFISRGSTTVVDHARNSSQKSMIWAALPGLPPERKSGLVAEILCFLANSLSNTGRTLEVNTSEKLPACKVNCLYKADTLMTLSL